MLYVSLRNRPACRHLECGHSGEQTKFWRGRRQPLHQRVSWGVFKSSNACAHLIPVFPREPQQTVVVDRGCCSPAAWAQRVGGMCPCHQCKPEMSFYKHGTSCGRQQLPIRRIAAVPLLPRLSHVVYVRPHSLSREPRVQQGPCVCKGSKRRPASLHGETSPLRGGL